MRVEDLRNYGRPLNETAMNLPARLQARAMVQSLWTVVKELGLAKTLRIMWDTRGQLQKMASTDLSEVREKGCKDEKFIKSMTQAAAFFKAMENQVGLERTLEVHRKIMDHFAITMNEAVVPSASDMRKFQDQGGEFAAFRQYVMALWEADTKAGLHFFEVVENSDKVLAVNITYCAYCRISQLHGAIEACESYCYSDDVFFPEFLKPFGIEFKRTQSLGMKGAHCDFRFENVGGGGNNPS